MTALPGITSFTAPMTTEGEFKTALSNLHLFLSGLLGTTGNAADAQAALGALLGGEVATGAGGAKREKRRRKRSDARGDSEIVRHPSGRGGGEARHEAGG